MYRIIFSVLLIFTLCTAVAQQRYLFNRYTTNDGLVSNQVFCTIQDRMGYMWVGTSRGLQRFDGKRFITIPLTGNPPLSVAIYGLESDNDGNIIVLAGPNLFLGSDVGILNPQTFQYRPLPILSDKKVADASCRLIKDRKGNIYLASLTCGLFELDRGSALFRESSITKQLPINWHPSLLYEDKANGNLWLPTDSGMVLYDPVKKIAFSRKYNPQNLGLLNEEVKSLYALYFDDQRRCWMADYSQEKKSNIRLYDMQKGKFLSIPSIIPSRNKNRLEVWKLLHTRTDQLWGFGFQCLLNFDSKANRIYQYGIDQSENNRIEFSRATDLYEDRQGLLWISTSEGLYFFNPKREGISRQIAPSVRDNYLFEILQPMPNEIWAGTLTSGILLFDTAYNLLPPAKQKLKLENTWIFKLIQSSHSMLVYATTATGEVLSIDPITKKIVCKIKPGFDQDGVIHCIAEDKNGNIWLGTTNNLLLKLPAGKPLAKANLILAGKLSSKPLRLFSNNSDNLYVCTLGSGIEVIDINTGHITAHYLTSNNANSLSSNTVWSMAQLNDSLFYIACEGLDILNVRSGQIKRLWLPDRSPARAKRLILSKNGVLWFSNEQGIYSYDHLQNRFSKFGKDYGFLKTENQIATLLTNNNKIVFAGDKFVSVFDPNELTLSNNAYPVTLSEVHLFDKPISYDSLKSVPLKLTYNLNSLSFFFSTLYYMPGQDISYYYRLKGAEERWIKADQVQSVTYSLLPPGSYSFEIYSQTSEGARSDITSFSFVIRPPFWRTWWFTTLCVLIIAISIHIFYRQRIQRILAIQQVRQRVARDLHDDMGSTLSSINILSGMAEEKLKADPIQSREYITRIKDNSKNMMEAMNYIVWSINPNNDSMQKVLVRMRTFATEVLEAKGIDLRFTTNKQVEQIQLDMERKRDLFLIYKEAINNAAKYSEGTQVTINLQLKNNHIQLNVQDNGKGFLPGEIRGGGNGLDNMQKRTLALKGSLEIHSMPGQGTHLFLSIPVK